MTLIACTKEHYENVILPRTKREIEDPKLYFGMIEPQRKNYNIIMTKDGKREAIIKVYGELGSSWWGTRYSDIQDNVKEADSDPEVDSIILDINSPGGYVDGVSETAEVIRNAKKPTIARVGYVAASGAYWLACACNKIEATTKVAIFGSIGVVVSYYDWSKYLENNGIKEIVITSTDAPKKRLDPATEEGRNDLLEILDKTHTIFAEAVAIGRKTTIEKVNSDFGKGGVLIASDALKVGMIDKINIGEISNNSEEYMTQERTYSQAEYDSGVKCAVENVLKHAKFIGRAKTETVIANMTAMKPYADCVEDYCEQEAALKTLNANIEASDQTAHVGGDQALKDPKKEDEEKKASDTVNFIKAWNEEK